MATHPKLIKVVATLSRLVNNKDWFGEVKIHIAKGKIKGVWENRSQNQEEFDNSHKMDS